MDAGAPGNNIFLNVSGVIYEISKKTWLSIERSLLETHGEAVSKLYTETSPGTYFFERNPTCFPMILSFFQERVLHMPPSVCPSEFKNELDFWGINPAIMAKCCYIRYVGYFDDQKVLCVLDKDQVKRLEEKSELERREKGQGWRSLQAKAWNILEEPSSGLIAQIYFYVSAFFVIVSISTLVSGTHKAFRRGLTVDEWREYFGDEFYKYQAHFDGSDLSNTTVPPLPTTTSTNLDFLQYTEYITVTYFTVELIMRIIFCPFKKVFFVSFLNLVDIFALFVMYSKYIVNAINPKDKYQLSMFDIVHCLQIVRIFRLFRLVRNYIGFRVLLYTLKASGVEMMLMSMFLLVAILMFGAFAFFSGDASFESIPDGFWWAIITMTTVGYGDIHPTTGLSKFVGAMCAVTGLFLLAVIIPIFVNHFLLFYSYSKVWGPHNNVNCKKKSSPSVSPFTNKIKSMEKNSIFNKY